eukprot:4088499-Pyramimonas_sp.AAC.1
MAARAVPSRVCSSPYWSSPRWRRARISGNLLKVDAAARRIAAARTIATPQSFSLGRPLTLNAPLGGRKTEALTHLSDLKC